MKIRRVALATLAAAALLGVTYASAALNAYRTKISLAEDKRTTDGKLLKAGKYDLEINFSGVGNQAEFVFLQNANVVGRQAAQAHGFPAQAPKAVAAPTPDVESKDINQLRTTSEGASSEARGKTFGEIPPARSAKPFDWAAAGFGPNTTPKTSPARGGGLIIAVDSSNSAAGFKAELLPAAKK